jgi:hypothetical protein
VNVFRDSHRTNWEISVCLNRFKFVMEMMRGHCRDEAVLSVLG